MRFLLLFITVMLLLESFSQPLIKIQLFGIVVSPDSVPVSDVSILNIWSGRVVRTNANGFFQTEIAAEDSLLVYHIAFKKQFINKNHTGKYIILQPEIQELIQIDINSTEQEYNNMVQTINDIKRLAPMKKLAGYDDESRTEYFVIENGSHTKGFKYFFGPTIIIPVSEIAKPISELIENRQQIRQSSHIHLLKE